MNCRACGSPARLAFVKDGEACFVCPRCGALSRPKGPGDFASHYSDYLPAATLRLPPATRIRYQEMLGEIERFWDRKRGRLLDVGAGAGLFLEVAREGGWEGTGTELSAAAVKEAARRGNRVLLGDLEECGLAPGTFDVVVSLETLEHVPEPVAFLGAIRRLLAPGGGLFLTTPNYAALNRRLLGREWLAVSPDHVCLFTPNALRKALAAAGLSVERVRTRTFLPNEALKRFRPGPARRQGFRPAETARLQASFEIGCGPRTVKRIANTLLAATGLGDVLTVIALKA